MSKNTGTDKLTNLLLWLQRGAALLGVLYILIVAIGKGIGSGSPGGFILWVLAGIAASLLIGLIHLGFVAWNMTYDWLTIQLGKYIKIRRGIVIGFVIAVLVLASLLVFYTQMDNLLRAMIGVFFLLMVPSAITSMLQEDRRREQFALIGSRIAPDLIAQNPQAAIEHAFTLFEDHLRKRLGVGADVYGESLINLAYGQNGKLFFGAVESERAGVRNFVSGAYSVYRNPRKHRVVQDDRLTTVEIISVVELLMRLVDESVEKSTTSYLARRGSGEQPGLPRTAPAGDASRRAAYSISIRQTMTATSEESSSAETEQIIREYFGTRPGWTVVKLDSGKARAADFRICDNSDCFLCEAKTVESVRANYPDRPIEYYLEQRKKRQEEIEKWKRENPGKQLILPPGGFEFIYGDETEFIKKYSSRKRSTEKWFKEFAQTMKEYFASSPVRDLPYSLRLDSNDLYLPNSRERDRFFEWLEIEIQAINDGNPSWQWHIQKLQYGQAALYSTFYQIHTPVHENDVKAEYQLTLEGPRDSGVLEVNIYSYGGLNLDSITSNVEGGLKQLESSATRESDHRIPRVIVLAFESGIGFEQQELSSHIAWLLKSHPDLSAIAVLEWIPSGTPPPPEDGFLAWVGFQATTPWVYRFVVYHNRWRQDVRPLPTHVFSDKWSVQLSPIK